MSKDGAAFWFLVLFVVVVKRGCGMIESEKLKYVIAKGNYDSALIRV